MVMKVLPKMENKNGPTKILVPFCLHNTSLAYRKLPEPLLKLSVLKLDGSSFSFHVARNATVARLKLAVEEEFSLFPENERKILWSLVWSHFSLCYQGQNLITDKACIQKYGIKDGDQLHFIRHLRIDLPPTPQRSENRSVDSKQCSLTNANEDQHEDLKYLHGEDLDSPLPKSGLTSSLKQLLTCSSFQCSKRKEWERMD